MAHNTSVKRTIVIHGVLGAREMRIEAARGNLCGVQIMSVEQLAIRLAGGFTKPIDRQTLLGVIFEVLQLTGLGELESIRLLPGMVSASASTLQKVWLAGIDLGARAHEHPRLQSLASLEAGVLKRLPHSMMRPNALVDAACRRLEHAKAILGPIEIKGVSGFSPCWRPLITALAEHTPITWTAGPRIVPKWLDPERVRFVTASKQRPKISVISAATAYHEAVEAMRWARALLASGDAKPTDIAIVAASTLQHNGHFMSLRADCNFDLHFVHGIKVLTTRDGQAAAALADILTRGLTQSRLRRLAALCRATGPFATLPEGWMRILPADAPLSTPSAWSRLLGQLTVEHWPDGQDHTATLRSIVERLGDGMNSPEVTGAAFLSARALAIWRKALAVGPSGSINTTLETLKQADESDACASVIWTPARLLAATSRRYVRLLGMNASRWPRETAEDRLISDHIIPKHELDPLPVNVMDRQDFQTILATTERQVVLSRARRNNEGRLLSRSALLDGFGEETEISSHAVPAHAFSETDRLTARPGEFSGEQQALSANQTWQNWSAPDITVHDGLVRANHPVVLETLDRTQSASSLRLLLRNPFGFVCQYGMQLKVPQSGTEPLILDPRNIGNLIHFVLDRALQNINVEGGLAKASENQIATAVQRAVEDTAGFWETEHPVPPAVIWRWTLDHVRTLAHIALNYDRAPHADTWSYAEVPFGGAKQRREADFPWKIDTPVEIPGTGFCIKGVVDRLDWSCENKHAHVRDYKTGKLPNGKIQLDGGRELQRSLYAFAVKALLGSDVTISAALFYLREQKLLKLENPESTLNDLIVYLRTAREKLATGYALIGIDAGADYDEFAFALPAIASALSRATKKAAAARLLGDATQVWGAP